MQSTSAIKGLAMETDTHVLEQTPAGNAYLVPKFGGRPIRFPLADGGLRWTVTHADIAAALSSPLTKGK
jgi:hypothetical protein